LGGVLADNGAFFDATAMDASERVEINVVRGLDGLYHRDSLAVAADDARLLLTL
jgi:hypothetical protein